MEFLAGLPESARRRRRILVIQAWIDDSGAKGQGGYMTLAGLMGTADEWAQFSTAWDRRRQAPPIIGYLSTRDAIAFRNEFEKFRGNQPLRDEKVRWLVSTVNDFDFWLVHSSVDLAGFNEQHFRLPIPKGQTPRTRALIKGSLAEPYFFCLFALLYQVAYILNDWGITERFEIYFDEQDRLSPVIKAWYPLLRRLMGEDLSSITPVDPLFRDDKEHPPLQIADFFAWCLRRDFSGQSNAFRRIAQSAKVKAHRYSRGAVTSEKLAAIFSIPEELRQSPVDPELQAEVDRILQLRRRYE